MRDPILSSWNIIGRLYTVAICIMVAFDSAFIPSASYAYGHRLYKRVVRLCLHTFWITFVYAGIMSAIVMIWPVELTKLFSKEKDVLFIAKKFMWIAFLSLPIYPVHAIVISFLQAIKRPTRATVLSLITTLVPMPIFSAIFYFTHPDSLAWIFGAYIATDISTSLITLVGMSSIFFRMMKLNNGDEFSDEEEIQSPSIPITKSVESIADIDK